MNTLQRILRSGGTDLRQWYKRNIKKPIVLWWERKTNFNPYGVWPEGACPVQAEGYTEDGKWYYFRARGNHASIVICESEEAYTGMMNPEVPYLFDREIYYGVHSFQAGWMAHEDAVRLVTVWLNEYYVLQQDFKISKKTIKWLKSAKQRQAQR